MSLLQLFFIFQSKDEVSAFKFLHMLMQLYNYRDVYASELVNLQVYKFFYVGSCEISLESVVSSMDPHPGVLEFKSHHIYMYTQKLDDVCWLHNKCSIIVFVDLLGLILGPWLGQLATADPWYRGH